MTLQGDIQAGRAGSREGWHPCPCLPLGMAMSLPRHCGAGTGMLWLQSHTLHPSMVQLQRAQPSLDHSLPLQG